MIICTAAFVTSHMHTHTHALAHAHTHTRAHALAHTHTHTHTSKNKREVLWAEVRHTNGSHFSADAPNKLWKLQISSPWQQ